MANTHLRIQNVIIFKRYVRDLSFKDTLLTVTYMGGRKEQFRLVYPPIPEEISFIEQELEDR